MRRDRLSQQVANVVRALRPYRHATTFLTVFMLGLSSPSHAEYIIYLKGGHFVIADDCTFATGRRPEKGPKTGEQLSRSDKLTTGFTEDCTKGKPKGSIFWSTIDGKFGEVNADDVYAIVGTKSLPRIKSADVPMPLEDYLITNRGESVVNAKNLDEVEEKDIEVHGLKRDELTKINRRGIIEIAPESVAKSRSGEGLCPGEPPEFGVSETEIVSDRLIGVVTNLSKDPWEPRIDVEIRVKGRRLGKFEIKDPNILSPSEQTAIDYQVPERFLKELARLKDNDAGVRVCYRKVKRTTKGPTAEKTSAQ